MKNLKLLLFKFFLMIMSIEEAIELEDDQHYYNMLNINTGAIIFGRCLFGWLIQWSVNGLMVTDCRHTIVKI